MVIWSTRISRALLRLSRAASGKAKANSWAADQQRAALVEATGDFGRTLGFAGGAAELDAIVRRCFASRMVAPDVAKRMGLRHSSGLLLHGPPGTGKTLLARGLAKTLSTRPPKLVRGPEIFSHLLGASEEAIRRLFKAADEEWKVAGEASALHVIVFDEVDAVLRRRGSGSSDGSGAAARDGVVNQLLAKLDGLTEQTNVLTIATTNRIDLIDPAALRPGRLDVHVELNLPDADGRAEILAFHAAQLESGVLAEGLLELSHQGESGDATQDQQRCNVLHSLAHERTVNFSGAEIEAVIRNAASFALERALSEARGDARGVDRVEISEADLFRSAAEVEPMFGASAKRDEGWRGGCEAWRVDRSSDGGWVNAHARCTQRSDAVVAAASPPPRWRSSLALVGPRGAGKRDLAAQILAEQPQFVFQRSVDASLWASTNVERARDAMVQLFADATRAPRSVIVLRDVDLLAPELHATLLALLRQEATRTSSSRRGNGGDYAGAAQVERRLLVIATVNIDERVGAVEAAEAATSLFDERVPLYPGVLLKDLEKFKL